MRNGEIVGKTVATKHLEIDASPSGGTRQHPIEPEQQQQAALTDAQVVRLAQLGRRIEKRTSAAPRTSNGVVSTTIFSLSRADQSQP